MTNKDIARSLGIAEHPVKIHGQHSYQKLRLHRSTDLLLRWKPDSTNVGP
ncbi:MAG: LuxR family transcriptional regulator [Woeseiaceae bacterium]|nr:LuxR family transcriptional regulator [Woeseiaceae bacterium]